MKIKKRKQSIGNLYFRPKSFLNIYRFLWIVIRVCLYTRSYVCYIYLRQFYKGINTVLSFVTSYKFNGYTVMVVLVVWNKEILFIRCIYLNRKRLTRNTEISQKENMFLFISWFMPSLARNVFILFSMICSPPQLRW